MKAIFGKVLQLKQLFPFASHLKKSEGTIYKGMSAFKVLLLKVSLSLSVSVSTLVYVFVCASMIHVCRCHRKLCAPWNRHDRNDETLFIDASLCFQPHWNFLFQGKSSALQAARPNVIGCCSKAPPVI